MKLCVYNDLNDPIVKSLHQSELKEDIKFLSVEEILNDVIINDEIEHGIAKLSWTLKSGEILTNSSATLLINRVSNLDVKLFDDFHPEDKDYAYQEFWAYLSFALSAFPRTTANPNHLGLSGPTAPLPMQWQELKTVYPETAVPEFYLGPREFYNNQLNEGITVISDPYNLYVWKPNLAEKINNLSAHNIMFAFERPKGMPISIFVSGNKIKVLNFEGCHFNEEQLHNEIKKLQTIFDLKIGEYLLFIDNQKFNFGCAQTFISKPISKSEWFSSTLIEGVEYLCQK